MNTQLRALVVGVRSMGAHHARALAQMPEYELAGICDLDLAIAHGVADPLSVPVWSDLGAAMRESGAEVVSICTPNTSHAYLTIAAAEAGVRAINCEKPMAVNFGDARRMAAVCAERDVLLIVNHQRRLGPDLRKARELIVAGAIGDLVAVEGICGGDFLSDGTHLVDSLTWLAGDVPPATVIAELELFPRSDDTPNGFGTRFGHVVEKSLTATVTLEDGVELRFVGGTRAKGRVYQDYMVIGKTGRLWRVGDRRDPNLFIEVAGQSGDLTEAYDREAGFSYPSATHPPNPGAKPIWRTVELPPTDPGGNVPESYRRLHACLTAAGAPHPLRAEVALRNFEIVMAAYESGRLGQTLPFPLRQDRFPLEIMQEERAAAPTAAVA